MYEESHLRPLLWQCFYFETNRTENMFWVVLECLFTIVVPEVSFYHYDPWVSFYHCCPRVSFYHVLSPHLFFPPFLSVTSHFIYFLFLFQSSTPCFFFFFMFKCLKNVLGKQTVIFFIYVWQLKFECTPTQGSTQHTYWLSVVDFLLQANQFFFGFFFPLRPCFIEHLVTRCDGIFLVF